MIVAWLLRWVFSRGTRLAERHERTPAAIPAPPPPIVATLAPDVPAPPPPRACLDWLDPDCRDAYLSAVGLVRYEEERLFMRKAMVTATFNGHDVRPFFAPDRTTIVYRLDGVDHPSMEEAEMAAALLPAGSPLL